MNYKFQLYFLIIKSPNFFKLNIEMRENLYILGSLFLVIPLTFFFVYYPDIEKSFHQVQNVHLLTQYDENVSQKLIKDIDLSNPEILEEEIEKIKRLRNVELPINNYFVEKRNKIRNLEGANENFNVFTNPVAVIEFGNQSNFDRMKNAYSYLLLKIEQYTSKHIFYPYSFDYTYKLNETEEEVTKHFEEGALFALNNKSIPYQSFQFLMSNSTIQFKKARAIYDADIAVFRLTTIFDNFLNNLFYDSDSFSAYFGTYFGKFSVFLNGIDEYITYKKSNPLKTAFVFIDHKDIQKGALFNEYGQPRFGLFILPDHILGSDTLISSLLTKNGRDQIVKYIKEGGNLWATGKSGFLLEHLEIIPEKTYNTSYLLNSDNVDRKINITGCENAANKTYESKSDYLYQVICNNYEKIKDTYLSSTYPLIPGKASGLSTLVSIDKNDEALRLADAQNGIAHVLSEEEKRFLPLFMHKKFGKGNVFVMNGNPFYSSTLGVLALNTIIAAFGKPMYLTSKVKMGDTDENIPIPAGEAGIHIDVEIIYNNLDDQNVKNFDLNVYLPNNVLYIEKPSMCEVSTKEIPEMAGVIQSLNKTSHLLCHIDSINAYEQKVFNFKIEIEDYTVTQRKYNILLLYPIAFYVDSTSNKQHYIDNGGVKTDASLAAVLRGALNPDPSSFYPLPGKGTYVDNVIKVENKEDTSALEVEYVGIIPMVGPVTDISDQGSVAYNAKLYYSYYKDNGYKLPLVQDGGYDYLDVKYLNDKDVQMVAEWDSPVKPSKELRTDKFPPVDNPDVDIHIKGINHAISVNSTNDVIKQINFRKSDRFYMHASQRLLAFIDSSGINGSQALYNGNIPSDWVDPSDNRRTKKEITFARMDLFFYDNENYQIPNGTNTTFVFTLDKYKKLDKPCVEEFGTAKSEIMVKGYFDDTKEGGLKPNEWSNEMRQYCHKIYIDPTNQTMIDEYTNKSGTIVPTHYLVQVKDSSVTRAGQIYGFIENEDQVTGYLEEYPSVKFVKAYSLKMKVKPEMTRQGGKIEIQLPKGVSVKDKLDITFSPDQIAFYQTDYDSSKNIITGYFKRGLLPNEAYGKDSLINVNIENSGFSEKTFTASVNIYEVKFDISSPKTQFETYYLRQTTKETFTLSLFYSYPAIEVRARLNRQGDQEMRPYETLEPFTRYGLYIQELIKHRTLWGSAESHHQTEPGMQSLNFGFSVLSNLGISSIPFVEYLTTGAGLMIPSTPTTSRIEWKDVWGRKWTQPLRTVFPDVAPIPPPLKNFMMSTSFEVLQKNGNQVDRLLEWPSDEEAMIHIHIKLLNNYPKYFELTKCRENEMKFIPKKVGERHDRVYELPPYPFAVNESEITNDEFYLSAGGRAKYGYCFLEEGTIVQGKKLDDGDRKLIEKAILCADSIDPKEIAKCEEELKDNQTNKKRSQPAETCPQWIYSPTVESYYPHNYIKDDMWDLTHIDYDDNAMYKSYKYHMDNNLPNIDMGASKPFNVIMQPIFKGLGYDVSYNKNTQFFKDNRYKGWWSDNLQNKDDTLLAGQAESNDVSVDKKDTLPWLNIRKLLSLDQAQTSGVVEGRLKNIYACLFNQHRVKVNKDNKVTTFLGNVNVNNIVPIIPDLEATDPRLYNYDCNENVYQYSPQNISQIDNVVATPTDKDYLYFAANLRGGAKENIHVLATIKPIGGVNYEGLVKVNEGGRFVYWNPANGPNSFLIVDNPVNVINSKRNDLSIDCEIFPTWTTTFKGTAFHLYTVFDESKLNKEWPFSSYYTNSFGFGDSTILVYIGGVRKSRAVLEPGQETYAKVAFYNNAGFDWNLKYEAIDFEEKPPKPSSSSDLLSSIRHTIKVPKKYNFMKVNLPKELEPYIKVEPSDHNADVAPEFFDFGNINVVTIRDGFKGEYFYKIRVDKSFPDKYRGKPIEIGLEIVENMFDKLPGYNDPTSNGFHDYHLSIPPLLIGVPYKEGEFSGKVLFTSSRSTDLKVKFDMQNDWQMIGFKYIEEEQIKDLREASSKTNATQEIKKLWESLPTSVPYEEKPVKNNIIPVIADVSNEYPTFPKPNGYIPDKAKFYILAQTYAEQLEFGRRNVVSNINIDYNNWNKKSKTNRASSPYERTISSKGAWLTMGYNAKVQLEDNGVFIDNPDQRLFPTDNGTMKVMFTMRNRGSDYSYNTNFTLIIQPNLTIREDLLNKKIKTVIEKNERGQTLLTYYLGKTINVGEAYSEVIYLDYKAIINTNKTNATINDIPKYLPLIEKADASLDLTNTTGEVQVKESLNTPCTKTYTPYDREVVAMQLYANKARRNPHIKLNITANPKETKSGYSLKYQFFKKYLNEEIPRWIAMNNASDNTEIEDDPVQTAEKNITFNSSVKVIYKIETYSEKKEIVSMTMILYDSSSIGFSMIDFIALGIGIGLFVISMVLFIIFFILKKKYGDYDSDEVEVKGETVKGTVKAPLLRNSNLNSIN